MTADAKEDARKEEHLFIDCGKANWYNDYQHQLSSKR